MPLYASYMPAICQLYASCMPAAVPLMPGLLGVHGRAVEELLAFYRGRERIVALVGPPGCGKQSIVEVTAGLAGFSLDRVDLEGETAQLPRAAFYPQTGEATPIARVLRPGELLRPGWERSLAEVPAKVVVVSGVAPVAGWRGQHIFMYAVPPLVMRELVPDVNPDFTQGDLRQAGIMRVMGARRDISHGPNLATRGLLQGERAEPPGAWIRANMVHSLGLEDLADFTDSAAVLDGLGELGEETLQRMALHRVRPMRRPPRLINPNELVVTRSRGLRDMGLGGVMRREGQRMRATAEAMRADGELENMMHGMALTDIQAVVAELSSDIAEMTAVLDLVGQRSIELIRC